MRATGGCLCGVVRYGVDGPKRAIGPACGSNVFRDEPAGDAISICVGALDAPTGLRLPGRIFVAQEGDCCEIADGRPQAARDHVAIGGR